MGASAHFIRKEERMEKPKCPYSVSGMCTRHGCIYLPDLNCRKGRKNYASKRIKHPRHNEHGLERPK